MAGFKIIDASTAHVGNARPALHVMDSPLEGKWRYLIDGDGHERASRERYLPIHELRGTRPSDMPNGLSLSIYQPKSSFRQICYFTLQKFEDRSSISVVVSLDFADWHLPKNLRDFADDYRMALLSAITHSAGVSIEQNEAGYSLTCTAQVPASTDIYSAYGALVDEVLAAYRKALADLVRPSTAATSPTSSDSHGPRWWIRYVVVPVLGSGAVAAAVAAVLALIK